VARAAVARAVAAAVSPLDGPGCLGVPATSVHWLQRRCGEGLIPAALARRHQVDVSGRPLEAAGWSASAALPGRTEP
jgi:hypothetical protein